MLKNHLQFHGRNGAFYVECLSCHKTFCNLLGVLKEVYMHSHNKISIDFKVLTSKNVIKL